MGRVYLGQRLESRVSRMTGPVSRHFPPAHRVLLAVRVDRPVVAQVVGIWVCFSLEGSMLCNTKITEFYFEPSLFRIWYYRQKKASLEPVSRYL